MSLISKDENPILIIFQNRKPFSVITDKHRYYDVEYCRRDDCLYWHMSGAGYTAPDKLHEDGGGETWIAPGYAVNPELPGRNSVILERPDPYKEHPSQWEKFEEEETIYCAVCADFLPEDWGETHLCDHVWWDDDEREWTGPGYDG